MSIRGKNVVFTGTLTTKRAEAKRLAEAAGATVHGSVSGTTNIVVAGPDAVNTGKVKAAEAKNVLIWTEANFLASLSGKGSAAAPKREAASAAAAAPLKRPAAAVAEPAPTPAAKRAKVVGSSDKPFHGMLFYRAGAHNYNAALGSFIRSLGGDWTKNPKQAAYCLDGIEIMRSSYMFAAPYIRSIEAEVPIVCLPLNFTRGKPSDKDKESLLKAMKGAEELLPKIRKEGMSSMTIAEMYRKEFKQRFPDYHDDPSDKNLKRMYESMANSFKEAEKRKTGSYAVLVKDGGKLKFEIRRRGK